MMTSAAAAQGMISPLYSGVESYGLRVECAMPPQPQCAEVIALAAPAMGELLSQLRAGRQIEVLNSSDERINEPDRLTLVVQIAAYPPGHLQTGQASWLLALTVRPFRADMGDLITAGGPVVVGVDDLQNVGSAIKSSKELQRVFALYY